MKILQNHIPMITSNNNYTQQRKEYKMSDLDPKNQYAFSIMQKINFGRIENLEIRDGIILFTEQSRTISSIKLDNESSTHHNNREDGDFLLKNAHITFIEKITNIKIGFIPLIQIQYGLPILFELSTRVNNI